MGILSFVPELLPQAEKIAPGHGSELFQAFDQVATATFIFGLFIGIFLTLAVYLFAPDGNTDSIK